MKGEKEEVPIFRRIVAEGFNQRLQDPNERSNPHLLRNVQEFIAAGLLSKVLLPRKKVHK